MMVQKEGEVEDEDEGEGDHARVLDRSDDCALGAGYGARGGCGDEVGFLFLW